MNCVEVRDSLTEHALGLLPAHHAAEVDRHLHDCTACRKEARELQDGVARIRAYGGNRALELVCVMPADIGSHAMERYIGVFGEDHKLLSGSVTTVAQMVEEFEQAGLHHLVCSFRDVRLFRDERIDEINRQMRLFAKEVLPSFVG